MLNRISDSSEDQANAEVNISPLIDVVFLLLIFFMVTSVFVEETGIEVSRPSAASAVDLDRGSIMLAIDADGSVFFDGREIPINAVRGLVARLLRERERPVVIIADAAGTSGTLVRIIDECKLAGSESVSVAATPATTDRGRH